MCVHAALVNTMWYDTWSECTLFVDPIIDDVQGLSVLTRTQGQPCNRHHTRHAATALTRFSIISLSRLLRRVSRWSLRFSFACLSLPPW